MLSFKRYLEEFKIDIPKAKEGLGIKRDDMPQIEEKYYDEYFKYLKKNGINITKDTVDPDDLKPTQSNFSKPGIERSIEKFVEVLKGKRELKPIIVSSDNRVIDGHHRWLAHKSIGMKIPILKANVSAKKLLDVTHEFPNVRYKALGSNKVIQKEGCEIFEELVIEESEFEGRKVKLNDPIRTSENPKKKFKVYVHNDKGNVIVVRFGDPNMEIKRDDPGRRASFRARHNCGDPGPKWKARYWSCWQWRAGAKVDN